MPHSTAKLAAAGPARFVMRSQAGSSSLRVEAGASALHQVTAAAKLITEIQPEYLVRAGLLIAVLESVRQAPVARTHGQGSESLVSFNLSAAERFVRYVANLLWSVEILEDMAATKRRTWSARTTLLWGYLTLKFQKGKKLAEWLPQELPSPGFQLRSTKNRRAELVIQRQYLALRLKRFRSADVQQISRQQVTQDVLAVKAAPAGLDAPLGAPQLEVPPMGQCLGLLQHLNMKYCM